MSCDRCVDIHNAQACGMSGKPCECGCHMGFGYTYCGTIDPSAGAPDPTYISCNTTVTHCDETGCSSINLN